VTHQIANKAVIDSLLSLAVEIAFWHQGFQGKRYEGLEIPE
jgi:hypothetical protein